MKNTSSIDAVLVTGGAGYIGSHMVYALLDAGMQPIVLDNLSTGVRALLPADVLLYEGDVADGALVQRIIAEHSIRDVLHFAGSVIAPESVAKPLEYYQNNTSNSIALLRACVAAGVERFIFSSTAAVYGTPTGEGAKGKPVTEQTPVSPISPYGHSKAMAEQVLADSCVAHPLRAIALRYFNVAGADPKGRTGQATPNATHLIKAAIETALGKREALQIFGDDYDTPDGTGVRDFIHVSDLVAAHLDALVYLQAQPAHYYAAFNCGYGHGYSVRDVIFGVEKITGTPLPHMVAARRDGDIPALTANADKARTMLGWCPRYDALDVILKTALAWEQGR